MCGCVVVDKVFGDVELFETYTADLRVPAFGRDPGGAYLGLKRAQRTAKARAATGGGATGGGIEVRLPRQRQATPETVMEGLRIPARLEGVQVFNFIFT